MIQFLKESTFAVNDVIKRSWDLLRAHYFSVAGLCLCLFLTSNTSGILAFYLQEVNPFLSAFMAILFVIVYFGIQLTLFKYILRLIDHQKKIALSETIPSTKELSFFFIAMLSIAAMVLVVYLAISVIAYPFIYVVDMDTILQVNLVVAAVVTFVFLLRVAFYPFFIIDQHETPIRSIRLSIALTKGNITKLLLILAFFAILHLLYIYFNYMGYPVLSTVLSFISSFFVVPLSSVVIAMAYHSMMEAHRAIEPLEI
jgi:hypothetical protein